MIVGNNYTELMKCDYLDSNLQPASDMLLNCIGDKSKGNEGLCTSSYTHLYDNISRNSENIAIKRGMNAGYGILPNSDPESNTESVPKPVTQKKDFQISSNIEGFTGSFITDIPVEVLGFLLVFMQQQATPFLCQRIYSIT